MANTLNPYFPEYWAKVAQEIYQPIAIYRQVASFRAEKEMKDGDVFHRILPSVVRQQVYQRYTEITPQDISGTDQTLTVDNQLAWLFQVDDLDQIQANLELGPTYSRTAVVGMANAIDSDMLAEVVNATSTIDNAYLGGTAGDPITLTGSNVGTVFSGVQQKLAEQNISLTDLWGGVDPATAATIESGIAARETNWLGDEATRNGYMGNRFKFFSFDAYMTNNYLSSRVLAMATNPTNGDTVTITLGTVYGSVACVFTFVSSIGSTAGNVLIAGTADLTRANLVALINAPGTTTANGVAFTGAQLDTLQVSCYAVNDNSANTMTFYAKGRSVSTAETFTDATDEWTASLAMKRLMFAQRGAVDMVTQLAPTMKVRQEPRMPVTNIMGLSLWGAKTFTDGAQRMVQVLIKA